MPEAPPAGTAITTSSDIYNEALSHWKSSQKLLNQAIETFLSASRDLCDVLSLPATSPILRQSLEQTLVEIDSELLLLHEEEKRLESNRAALTERRNTSKTLILLHRLPSEVMTTIFEMCRSRYTRHDRTAPGFDDHTSPVTLSRVCSLWRTIALETPLLWSHIDVMVEDLYLFKRPKLWVERSGSVPLYLSISDKERSPFFANEEASNQRILEFAEFLIPLMHRTYALDIKLSRGPRQVISTILKCWMKTNNLSTRKTLQISDDSSNDQPSYLLSPTLHGSVSMDQFYPFFQSVTRLALRNCRIARNFVMPTGLVELSLEDLTQSHGLSQHRLTRILSQSPNLCALVLVNCWISKSQTLPTSVSLNRLTSLSLESDEKSHQLARVLPLLNIETDAVDLSLTLSDNPKFVAAASSFFARTRITRLYVKKASLRPLFCPMLHLQTLAIEGSNPAGQIFQDLFASTGDFDAAPPWPRLHTLYWMDLKVNINHIQTLLRIHPSIKHLSIHYPYTEGGDRELDHEEYQNLEDSLKYLVPAFRIEYDPPYLCGWDFVILD